MRELKEVKVAKFFSQKNVNREAFRQQIPRIFHAAKTIKVETVRENLFALEFKSMMDRKRTLNDRPHNFFKSLVVFKEVTYGTPKLRCPKIQYCRYMCSDA